MPDPTTSILGASARSVAARPILRAAAANEVFVVLAIPDTDAADFTLLARVIADAVARLGLTPGRAIVALLKSTSIEILGA